MDKLLAMQVFGKVVEAGSFVGAAERLNLSTTAVSRHVAELENQLGVRLLQRTTRRLHLTELGQLYYRRALHLLDDLGELEAELLQETLQPAGVLRLSVSIPFGARQLAPALARFGQRYPKVRVEVVASDRKLDLIEEGLDMALRITDELEGNMIARPISAIRTLICAAPDYLARRGAPQTPEELRDHDCLIYNGVPEPYQWRFVCEEGQPYKVPVTGPLEADNGDILVGAALAGMGILRTPSFMIGDALSTGQLVPLLSTYHMPKLTLSVLFPSRQFLPAKVRRMIDFLLEEWGGEVPPWEAGWRQPQGEA
ncbi:LysR family transcriptional regulator [Pseudaeromonas sp. ZJS20]|uniref:LysR family transcriptional regulator n=1 Tax=Pseudaeromonas aegiceratis TaxID=3153928 RepID=UPI00390CB662